MTDATAPSSLPAPVANVPNGTFPANDAAGEVVAAIAEADKISAGRRDSTNRQGPS
jgi:ubiquitin-like 1-activating enzyme E1 A